MRDAKSNHLFMTARARRSDTAMRRANWCLISNMMAAQTASRFLRQMGRAGRDILQNANVLMPVPLYKHRSRKRRFNQAALLARVFTKLTGIPYKIDTLLRAKNFHIVLIDDVQTTGSTLELCARALKKKGAERVDDLTLMRVIRPEVVWT